MSCSYKALQREVVLTSSLSPFSKAPQGRHTEPWVICRGHAAGKRRGLLSFCWNVKTSMSTPILEILGTGLCLEPQRLNPTSSHLSLFRQRDWLGHRLKQGERLWERNTSWSCVWHQNCHELTVSGTNLICSLPQDHDLQLHFFLLLDLSAVSSLSHTALLFPKLAHQSTRFSH